MSEQQTGSSRSVEKRDYDFPAAARYEDEISLYDLWNVLVRRLPIAIIVFVLVVVSGAAYALSQPTKYEFRSAIDLGRIHTGTVSDGKHTYVPIVDGSDAAASVRNEFVAPARDRIAIDGESAPSVSVSSSGDRRLRLTSTGELGKSDGITELHQQILNDTREWLLAREATVKNSVLAPHERRQAVLTQQKEALDDERAEIASMLNEEEQAAGLIQVRHMGDLRRQSADIELELTDIESRLTTIRELSETTRVSEVANRSGSPVGTNPQLIIALSVVLGGMLGLFAAFFWEFVSNAKRLRSAN